MMFPMISTVKGHTIRIARFPVRAATSELPNAVKKPKKYTGAVMTSVTTCPYPSVLVMVGKKYVYVCEDKRPIWIRTGAHTFGSVNASLMTCVSSSRETPLGESPLLLRKPGLGATVWKASRPQKAVNSTRPYRHPR